MQLTDAQWKEIQQFVSNQPKNLNKRGRPPLNEREVMNAILWVLGTGARWKQMPDSYPQYQTCRNYFYTWLKKGAIERTINVLANDAPLVDKDEIVFDDTTLGESQSISKKKLSEMVQKIQQNNLMH